MKRTKNKFYYFSLSLTFNRPVDLSYFRITHLFTSSELKKDLLPFVLLPLMQIREMGLYLLIEAH
jgi:hypothetical protein